MLTLFFGLTSLTDTTKPFIQEQSILAAGKLLILEEYQCELEMLQDILQNLALSAQIGRPTDTRRISLVVIRTVARKKPSYTLPNLKILIPAVFSSVRDMVIPIKLAAEAAFLELFQVAEEDTAVLESYLSGPGADLPAGTKRGMQDYFKRVALKLGSQARDRKDAEGGQGGLGLSADEIEDEKEIWSVGKSSLETDGFTED